MSNELHITDIQLGEGKAIVKGALITAHYTGGWRVARSLIPPTIEDSHFNVSSERDESLKAGIKV